MIKHLLNFAHTVKSEQKKMLAQEVLCDCELKKVGGVDWMFKIILQFLYRSSKVYLNHNFMF